MASPITFLSLFLLLPAFTSAQRSFVAYKEKSCSEPLEIWTDGMLIEDSKLLIDHSIKERGDFDGGHAYNNITFPAAPATGDFDQDAGTQFVYWKVEQPDPTCQFILMRDTPREWQSLSQMPGDVMLRVAEEGCYYTALNVSLEVIVSTESDYRDVLLTKKAKRRLDYQLLLRPRRLRYCGDRSSISEPRRERQWRCPELHSQVLRCYTYCRRRSANSRYQAADLRGPADLHALYIPEQDGQHGSVAFPVVFLDHRGRS